MIKLLRYFTLVTFFTTNMLQAQVVSITYENGLENSGYGEIGENVAYANRRKIETNLVRKGDYSIKHELRYADPIVEGSKRCESHNIDMNSVAITPGQIRYYGFSIYIPSTWVDDGNSDDIIFQWKGVGGPPFMFITQKNNGLFMRINYDHNTYWSESTITPVQKTITSNLQKGRWHDFRIRVVWQWENNGAGRVEVDYKLNTESNYTRVFNYIGENMYNSTGYLKWGIYKPDWTHTDTGVLLRAIWHDNILIGSSWTEVDPTMH